MLLDSHCFDRVRAMNPQYSEVAYSGACSKGVHFVCRNKDESGWTLEAERVIYSEEFEEVERRPVWRCGYDENGKSYEGDYPIAEKVKDG